MAVTVVVPVYNSEESLPLLVERLSGTLGPSCALGELILVNDCSRDRSWDVIQDLTARHSWIRGFNLMRNYGQHNALLCGIRAARYPVIVTIDDDLQTPPEEIPRLLAELDDGWDVVYGSPEHPNHGFLRDLASSVTKLALQSAMGAKNARKVSAFRAFRTHLRDAFANYSGSHVSIDVLLTWGTKSFSAIPVRNDPRTIGVSNYTLGKLTIHALNMMTGFSTLPLQIASIIGFLFTLVGMAVLCWVIAVALFLGRTVPGFPFLASIIAVFSGAQLFALGIIGEYLARMHFRMMDRPSYTVLSTVEHGAQAAQASTPRPVRVGL
ncbi:MAG TPA: glycosyltransferase family 2 protein [Bryobacteraceae bacterium]|nr:glycosyltransferase family 2 protein [Bryobacteraceae bacterium]